MGEGPSGNQRDTEPSEVIMLRERSFPRQERKGLERFAKQLANLLPLGPLRQ